MLTIAILAGGMSQRMGRDKAFLPFLGQPLICRVMDRMTALAGELLIVAPQTDEYLALGVRLVPDLLPGRGSLGGLYTALASASHPLVAVIPCDAPFVSPTLIAHEHDLLVSNDLDAVVPSSSSGLEPLHAVYRRDPCMSVVRDALDAGERRAIGWYARARVRILTPDEIAGFDPDLVFLNVNTPEEFTLAEQLAAK